MGKKLFTIDEVEQLIPQLEYHFSQLWMVKKEMARCSQRLKKLGISPELLPEETADLSPEAVQIQNKLKEDYIEFKKHLLAIEGMGGEVRDLELGRVDFPAKEGEQEVVLTWQMGVTEPLHQHPKG